MSLIQEILDSAGQLGKHLSLVKPKNTLEPCFPWEFNTSSGFYEITFKAEHKNGISNKVAFANIIRSYLLTSFNVTADIIETYANYSHSITSSGYYWSPNERSENTAIANCYELFYKSLTCTIKLAPHEFAKIAGRVYDERRKELENRGNWHSVCPKREETRDLLLFSHRTKRIAEIASNLKLSPKLGSTEIISAKHLANHIDENDIFRDLELALLGVENDALIFKPITTERRWLTDKKPPFFPWKVTDAASETYATTLQISGIGLTNEKLKEAVDKLETKYGVDITLISGIGELELKLTGKAQLSSVMNGLCSYAAKERTGIKIEEQFLDTLTQSEGNIVIDRVVIGIGASRITHIPYDDIEISLFHKGKEYQFPMVEGNLGQSLANMVQTINKSGDKVTFSHSLTLETYISPVVTDALKLTSWSFPKYCRCSGIGAYEGTFGITSNGMNIHEHLITLQQKLADLPNFQLEVLDSLKGVQTARALNAKLAMAS